MTRLTPGRSAVAVPFLVTTAVVLAGIVAYALVLRPWHMRWGATLDETTIRLPGDSYIPPSTVVSTRAITIRAPAEEVWPWIVQLGQGRGGYYSYEWLENLFAADMHNADRIVPEWQQLEVGDRIAFARDGPLDMVVADIIPQRALMMEGGWSWYLQPVDAHTTRLIVRYASFPVEGFLSALFYYPVFEPAHFVMESGMMLGIQQRAEAAVLQKLEATR